MPNNNEYDSADRELKAMMEKMTPAERIRFIKEFEEAENDEAAEPVYQGLSKDRQPTKLGKLTF